MLSRIALTSVLITAPICLGCKTINRALLQTALPPASFNKITFDLRPISPEGLVGSNSGLRSLSYEFCIPANAQSLAEIKAIDSTLQHSRSPGRIRCTKEQYLVIGDTHKLNWRAILTQLTQLNYVQRIDQFLGE